MAGERKTFTPTEVDQQVGRFLSLTPEENLQLWQTTEFLDFYPFMIERILSEEGLSQYSSMDRSIVFTSSLSALNALPWNKHDWRVEEAHIPFHGRFYDIDTQDLSKITSTSPNSSRKEAISRFIPLTLLLLGASLNDKEGAYQAFLQLYETHTAAMANLTMALAADSPARSWIKKRELDKHIGVDWDKEFPSFILSLPEYEPARIHKLPSFLSDEGLPLSTIMIYIDYILQFVQAKTPETLLKNKDTILMFLRNTLRSHPKVKEQADIMEALRFINGAINLSIDLTDTDAQVLRAREMIGHYLTGTRARRLAPYSVRRPGHDLIS